MRTSGVEDGSTVVGEGEYRYRVFMDWAKLPAGWSLGEVADIDVDDEDRVYVFNRGAHPVIVFDRDGNFLRSFGEGQITNAHSVLLAPDDTVFLTDDIGHVVHKCDRNGKIIFSIGTRDRPAPFMSNRPFNRCCQTALAPDGNIYVADGYGNASVHVFGPAGDYVRSWGRSGSGPGEFNIVHNIRIDAEGVVYIADRENHRIQMFDLDGKYVGELRNLHRPTALHLTDNGIFFIGELCPATITTHDYPNLGPRLTVMDKRGKLLARVGSQKFGLGAGDFLGPHGIGRDSRGDLYVGDVSMAQWNFFHPGEPFPEVLPCLRKLVKV